MTDPDVHQRPGLLRQALRQPGFLPCLLLLCVFAIGFRVWTVYAEVYPNRLPLKLQAQLDQLDRQKLYPPYKFLQASQLKPDMIDTLGTDQYISWALKDTTVKTGGPEQLVNLFVTYYTGKPDMVPHVPDICLAASGYQEKESVFHDVSIPALGITIPVKVIEFERSKLFQRDSRIVLYTFNANGRYAADRRGVLSILANPLDRYAYFSKVEMTFGTPEQSPSREVAIEAGERLLRAVIPLLEKEHWPDWESAVAGLAASRPGA